MAPPSAAHFLVTLVKRPGETSFGFRFRPTHEGHRLQCVQARSPAARWNGENCADECLLPRDIIVRADSDFRLASTRKVRLLIWRPVPFEEAVLAFNTAFMDDEHVPESENVQSTRRGAQRTLRGRSDDAQRTLRGAQRPLRGCSEARSGVNSKRPAPPTPPPPARPPPARFNWKSSISMIFFESSGAPDRTMMMAMATQESSISMTFSEAQDRQIAP